MSRLEELIQEMCPDGVEYKRFDEVCSLHARIGWQRLTRAEFKTSGEYLLITGTDFTESHEINYGSCVYVSKDRYLQDPHIQLKNGDILITKDGTLGKVAQVHDLEQPATLNGGVFVVRSKDGLLENRFILHYLLSSRFKNLVDQQKTGSTISHLTQALFSRLEIPLPPLPVQQEIVRILDSFTQLEAELEAELEDRKKQYSYYRDEVLTFDGRKDVQWQALGDVIISLNTGLNPRRFFKLNTDDAYNYYVTIRELQNNRVVVDDNTDRINDNALRLCNNRSNLETGDILFSGTGTIGEVAVIESTPSNWNIKEGVYAIKPNPQFLNSRFLMHLLRTAPIRTAFLRKSAGGTVKSVPMGEMLKLVIPLPPLAEQARIVSILDRFDTLCNDLTSGLPAEIDARQKQYAYYRDKLLTFKELSK